MQDEAGCHVGRWAQLASSSNFSRGNLHTVVPMVGGKKSSNSSINPGFLCENIMFKYLQILLKIFFNWAHPPKPNCGPNLARGPSASELRCVHWRGVKGDSGRWRARATSGKSFTEKKTKQQWGGVLGSGKEAILLPLRAGSSQHARGA